jgi:dimethylglycine dehydrogenase
MEHVNYFAAVGEQPYEIPSLRRSNAFSTVAKECRTVRTAVGINEIHNFSKFLVSGPGARDYLDRVMAGRIPKFGAISLCPMLSEKGRIVGDFSVSMLAEDSYQLTASYASQAYHQRWLERHLPDKGVQLKNISQARLGFQIAGPKAREVLQAMTREDVSHEAFKFMRLKHLQLGPLDAMVQRISYTGDLGYEIYVRANQQVALYALLREAGEPFGMRPFGMRAMMSLRLEKSFGSWLREYKPDYTPLETGLDRFVAYKKPADFIGKAAALAELEKGAARKLCSFIVDAEDADAVADEPIWLDNKVVGFVTSGGYAHYVDKSVAFGFLPVEEIEPGKRVEIEILGQRRPATLFTKTLFDPEFSRMKS